MPVAHLPGNEFREPTGDANVLAGKAGWQSLLQGYGPKQQLEDKISSSTVMLVSAVCLTLEVMVLCLSDFLTGSRMSCIC